MTFQKAPLINYVYCTVARSRLTDVATAASIEWDDAKQQRCDVHDIYDLCVHGCLFRCNNRHDPVVQYQMLKTKCAVYITFNFGHVILPVQLNNRFCILHKIICR